jgi:hypothetical protein
MLYMYLVCPHSLSLNTKTISSNLNSLNTFTKESGSSIVKLVLTSVNPMHNAQVCYFNNVWLMFLIFFFKNFFSNNCP